MTHPQVRTDTRGAVRLVFVDNPPVNTLTATVTEGLLSALDDANSDPAVTSIVLLGAGRTFVAGADITTLEPLAWDPQAPKPDLRPLLEKMESSQKPVVMAIHGTALGGGLELAMAGHYRVAVGRRAAWLARGQPRHHPRAPKAPSGCRGWSVWKRRSTCVVTGEADQARRRA